MTKNELEFQIKKMGIPPTSFSLDGKLICGIVLDSSEYSRFWRVFDRDEKGRYNDERHFYSEEEACDYMYSLILSIEKFISPERKEEYKKLYFGDHIPD